jgi:3-oxoacyl-[acyl-carrier-protein] synthase III
MMKYSRAHIDAIGYELAPVVVTTAELESRIAPVYEALKLPPGQVEALTGIVERRWWEPGYTLSEGATKAALKALAASNVAASQVGVLIYAGVCRENFEPATACKVAANVGVGPSAAVYDISNACLGVLNGIVDAANRIELGQCRAGLVVSCESAREINEAMISQMLERPTMDFFRTSLATLTGGSGAVAVLVTDGSFNRDRRRKLLGGITQTAPEHHGLCRWGLADARPGSVGSLLPTVVGQMLPSSVASLRPADAATAVASGVQAGLKTIGLGSVVPNIVTQFMSTDAGSVLRHGVDLGHRTWNGFTERMGWQRTAVDKVICHQVGAGHREAMLQSLGIPHDREFSTYEYLGNIGTVSLPLTAAIAEEREFLKPGDRVGFLGIGSGLNCLMLGIQW